MAIIFFSILLNICILPLFGECKECCPLLSELRHRADFLMKFYEKKSNIEPNLEGNLCHYYMWATIIICVYTCVKVCQKIDGAPDTIGYPHTAAFVSSYVATWAYPIVPDCGSISMLNKTSGLLKSHIEFGTLDYPPSTQCFWTLTPPVGFGMKLESIVFDVENSLGCSNDKLYIDDGNLSSIFCGRSGPTDFTSNNSLVIRFESNDIIQGLGFLLRISYNRVSGVCSNSSGILAPPGIITSPQYPQLYNNDCTCRWILNTDMTQTVTINIVDLHIEGRIEDGCPYDYLIFYNTDNRNITGRYCGSMANTLIKTNTSRILMEFITDGHNRDKGFQVNWTIDPILASAQITTPEQLFTTRTSNPTTVTTGQSSTIINRPAQSSTTAGITSTTQPLLASSGKTVNNSLECKLNIYLNGSSGYISLPTQSNNEYFSNSNCQWIIVGNPRAIIVVNFESFQLEGSKDCTADYLSFYDGVSISAPLLANICGKRLPASVVASSNTILITFHSDDSIQGHGFILHYMGIITVTMTDPPALHCPTDITKIHSESGTLTSIGFNQIDRYSPNLTCRWLISTTPGKVLSLRFLDFETEFAADCSYDYLEVRDGVDETGAVLAKYCGIRLPRDVTSSNNTIFIKFVSDAAVGGIGFNLTYQTKDPKVPCKMTEYTCLDGSCIRLSDVCNNVTNCADKSDEIMCNINETCGRPSIKPSLEEHRIVGGEEAVRGSWPWQASISNKGSYMCGGTLINPYWVLTAAHCFQQNSIPRDWKVAFGKHLLVKEERTVQTVTAADIIVHPDYDSASSYKDIALIKLSKPVNITNTVDVACLPTAPVNIGQRCFVTGWGETLGTCCRDVLKQAMVPILNTTLCNRRDFYNGKILDSMFCAGYLTKHIDACHGDSGGPMVCQYINGRWYLQGIISWGIGCADLKHPGVYTNVFNFIHWIQHIIYQI